MKNLQNTPWYYIKRVQWIEYIKKAIPQVFEVAHDTYLIENGWLGLGAFVVDFLKNKNPNYVAMNLKILHLIPFLTTLAQAKGKDLFERYLKNLGSTFYKLSTQRTLFWY